MEGFSKIAVPLIELTEKSMRLNWSDKCEASFQELKQRLITAPVLSLPKDNGKFVVYCVQDGSRMRVDAGGEGDSVRFKITQGVRAALSYA